MIRLKQWLLVKPVDINNFEVCRLVLPRSPVLQVDSLPAEPQGKPKDTGVGSLSLLQGAFLTQEFEPGSPALQADSLPAEPPGKPKDTGVGSLSLLQRIFLTQESTRVSCIAGGFFTN